VWLEKEAERRKAEKIAAKKGQRRRGPSQSRGGAAGESGALLCFGTGASLFFQSTGSEKGNVLF
jgi:hypothetical protein